MNDEFLNHVACIRSLIGTIATDVNLAAGGLTNFIRQNYGQLAQENLRNILTEVAQLEEEHDSPAT